MLIHSGLFQSHRHRPPALNTIEHQMCFNPQLKNVHKIFTIYFTLGLLKTAVLKDLCLQLEPMSTALLGY